jgi:chromosome segregation ATPase
MDAVKIKMDQLVKDKLELIKVAKNYEGELKDFEAKCSGLDKNIRVVEKEIANHEDALDTCLTDFISAQEKLDQALKIASDSELNANALTRKIKLIEEEQVRVDERYRECIAKVSDHEATYAINEAERKKFEQKSFAVEEKLELMVTQLEEANVIAEESDRKFEDVQRKANIVKSDLERMVEKAEDSEQKIVEFEDELRDKNNALRKLEDICAKNADKEDQLDNEQRSLVERLKVADTNAEFGERTVDKLESTIDGIQDRLFEEKTTYRNLSIKLDSTLRDMMKIAEEAHDCEE